MQSSHRVKSVAIKLLLAAHLDCASITLPVYCKMHLPDPNQILPGSFCRYYSLFTLAMLVMFESTVVTQRLRNLKELRSLQNPKQPIMVHRQGKWEKLPGDALLPGDVISIGRPAGGEFAAAM